MNPEPAKPLTAEQVLASLRSGYTISWNDDDPTPIGEGSALALIRQYAEQECAASSRQCAIWEKLAKERGEGEVQLRAEVDALKKQLEEANERAIQAEYFRDQERESQAPLKQRAEKAEALEEFATNQAKEYLARAEKAEAALVASR